MEVRIEEFKLVKIKTNGSGGLDIDYEVTRILGDEPFTKTGNAKDSVPPHPELTAIFQRATDIVRTVWPFTKKTEIIVKGISFSGKDTNRGTVITSTVMVHNGQKQVTNTPKLTIGTTYGYEEELVKIDEEMKKEAFEYIYNGKKAQTELELD